MAAEYCAFVCTRISCWGLIFFSIFLFVYQHEFGFSFVTGVPVTPEATEELAQRIGFIRETQCMCPHVLLKRT